MLEVDYIIMAIFFISEGYGNRYLHVMTIPIGLRPCHCLQLSTQKIQSKAGVENMFDQVLPELFPTEFNICERAPRRRKPKWGGCTICEA